MNQSMKLHNVDVKAFLEALDRCKGNVFLVTDEGDRLNLKSKLCQILGLARLIEGGEITEAKVVCEQQEDYTTLFRFNLFGEIANGTKGKED